MAEETYLHQGKALEQTLHLNCPSCGNELRWSAEKKQIACDYCGYAEEIDHSKDRVVEKSLAEAAQHVRDFVPEQVDKKVFDCQNCGAKFMVESDTVRVECGFCGSTNVNLEAYDHQYIQPVGIIPFYISRDEATRLFLKWIKKGWFHPNKLKKLTEPEHLHGIYIPFWTFDARTESDWSGEAGHYYYETRQVRVNGQVQTQRIRKTRWTRRSGHITHFFDDVLVVASGGMTTAEVNEVFPYRLEEVVNFDPRLLLGWESEIYQIEVDEGYHQAAQIMDDRLRQMCSAQLGGDTQRNLRVQSSKRQQTFKHLILPLWICSYVYQNKQYHFTINGQTGRVAGKKPLSWVKIVLYVITILAILAGLYFLRESGMLQFTI